MVVACRSGLGSCSVSFMCCNIFISGTDWGMCGGVSFAKSVCVFQLVWGRGCGLGYFLCSNLFISGVDYHTHHEVSRLPRVNFSFYSHYHGTSRMQHFCNSWHGRNVLVMVSRIDKSLKLAENIVSLHPHQPAQAQHLLSSHSKANTPLVASCWRCQGRHQSITPNFHAERSSPQTAGDLKVSNYTILNTIKLHAGRIWLFAACPDALNLLSVINPAVTMNQSTTWTRFFTSNTFKASQTRSLNHRHLLLLWWQHTPAPVLCLVITLLSDGNAMLRVAWRWPYKTIPTTRLQCVESTNESSVWSRRMSWRRMMTTCWRKTTPLCVSSASTPGMVSRNSWVACLMIRLSGSGKYTLWRIWDGMTITNAISYTGVETSSHAWDGWCGSQPTPSIVFTPHHVALTAIRHRNVYILKCTERTGVGRHSQGETTKDDDVLIDVMSTLRAKDTLVPLIFMSDGTHLLNFVGDKTEWPVYMTIGNLSSKIRKMPSMHSIIEVALPPIPIGNRNIPEKWVDEQRQTNWEVLNEVPGQVLQPFPFETHPSTGSGYFNSLCTDGNSTYCKPVLAVWLADCPE